MINYKGRIVAFISIIAANVIYGANYVVAKSIMPVYFSPLSIIFLRVAGTVIISVILFLLFVREKVQKKDFIRLIWASLFGISINQIMFFEGLNLTTPIDSAIIMTVCPIIVLIFSFFILKEKITFYKLFGIILGITGAILIILGKGKLSFSSETLTGNILIFVNATSFALYIIIIKPIMNKYNPITILMCLFALGFIFSLPFTIKPILQTNFNVVPLKIWLGLLYVIIFSTFLGYLLYNYSLRVLSPTVVSFFIYLQPILSTITTMIVFNKNPYLIDLFSTILIFTGVWCISIKSGTPLMNKNIKK